MTLRLCVLLWPASGLAGDLHAYEDAVLPLLAEHGGGLIMRERVESPAAGEPAEVQIIEFEDADALTSYLNDARRLRHEDERRRVVDHTQVLRLEVEG